MINLKDLREYNAYLLEVPSIAPAKNNSEIFDKNNINSLFIKKNYGLKEIKFRVGFIGKQRTDWTIHQSKFLKNLECGVITLDNVVYYEGSFTTSGVGRVFDLFQEIEIEGLCYATLQKVRMELAPGKHEIYNKGHSISPVKIEITGQGEIKGLTEKSIISTGAVSIGENRIIKNLEGENGFKLLQMFEMPNIRPGLNIIETNVPITIEWKPRLI